MKKTLSLLLGMVFLVNLVSCSWGDSGQSENSTEIEASADVGMNSTETDASAYADMTAEEITESLTLEQKAAQMTMAAIYNLKDGEMEEYDYGSILSVLNENTSDSEWRSIVSNFQEGALASDSQIPMIYGQDDVHGVNYCGGAVIFPHNIGIGAANDAELTYQMGLAVADEAKLCYMLWNFSPVVAQAADPRWGRTYESYSTDLDIIKNLSVAYVKGLNDGGVVSCAKHFFGDGNVEYGTGEDSDEQRLIDRGDAQLSDKEISALLDVYQNLVDNGVRTIMVSHSSVNGMKMHENEKYLQYLKNEMGFQGFVVADWDSVDNITGDSRKDKVITAINAGVDMLMQVDSYKECMQYIVDGVNEGSISEERVNDAVTRIIQVKKDLNLFEDPMLKNLETKQSAVGSDEYRQLAEQLVEKSLVMLKNDYNTLPFQKGTKIYICGPAADNVKAQCGGWTGQWLGSANVQGVTTILDAMNSLADEYKFEIITDQERADEADAVLLVVGETAYAEWKGDTEDLSLTGEFGLEGNSEAIDFAESLGKPTVACIVAGRQVILEPYYDQWDSVVMCYLPGSEGQGVGDVLAGKTDFSGKLPMPWYSSVDQIGSGTSWLNVGYGLSYKK